MSVKATHFRLGLFILIGATLGVGSVVVLGAGTVLRKKVMAETYLDESVQGLDVGAPVKFRGVHVGQLEKIDFAGLHYAPNATKDSRIRLTIAFFPELLGGYAKDDPVGTLLRLIDEGLRVRMASAGLTGSAYLELDNLDPKTHPPPTVSWTPEHPHLPSVPSTGTRMMTRVENVLGSVEKLRFDVISDKLVALLENLDRVVKSIDPAVEGVRKFTDEATLLARDARKVITDDIGKELKSLTSQVRDTLEKDVGPALRGIRTAADHLPGTFDKVDATLERIGATLRRVDRTLAEETGSMDEALDNLRSMTQDLRDLTGQLKRYPSQALFGEAPPKKGAGK
jgi:phospholipid/cholesterol/gamma-HCH transport system substrate-binding protein/paraquat-inducible protein B